MKAPHGAFFLNHSYKFTFGSHKLMEILKLESVELRINPLICFSRAFIAGEMKNALLIEISQNRFPVDKNHPGL